MQSTKPAGVGAVPQRYANANNDDSGTDLLGAFLAKYDGAGAGGVEVQGSGDLEVVDESIEEDIAEEIEGALSTSAEIHASD